MRWGWNKKVHRYIKYPMQYYITQGSVAFENTQTVTKSLFGEMVLVHREIFQYKNS